MLCMFGEKPFYCSQILMEVSVVYLWSFINLYMVTLHFIQLFYYSTFN